MNYKTEAARLAGSRKMDKDSFVKDIEMALENAADKRLKAVEDKLRAIQRESKEALARRLPLDPPMKLISDIANDYFEIARKPE